MANIIANETETTSTSVPDTVKIQKAIETIEDDLSGTIDGWFSEVEARLTDVQDVLKSAALRKVLSELKKLHETVSEKMQAQLADVRAALEMHDNDVVDVLESEVDHVA
jgi:hypothetical protein